MTRYFFDVLSNGKLTTDEEGAILPNIDAARKEASRTLGDLARDTIHTESSPSVAIEVRTSDGPAFEAAFQWSLGPKR